jgi:hypothetical protein
MRLGTGHKVCVLEGWRVLQNTTIKFGTPRKASENIESPPPPPSKEMKCFVPPPRTQPIALSPRT